MMIILYCLRSKTLCSVLAGECIFDKLTIWISLSESVVHRQLTERIVHIEVDGIGQVSLGGEQAVLRSSEKD
jgi:hypothetical protein